MSKIVLQDIGSGYNLQTVVNNNNDFLEEAFDNTLSRDGSSPNSMEAAIDMNSHRIINLAGPAASNDAARWIDITDSLELTGVAVPALAGNEGLFMTTDGVTLGWDSPATFIPQTDNEVLLGYVPFDYTRQEGDVRRYGNIGQGADDSVYIQRAADVAAYTGKLIFTPLDESTPTTYKCSDIYIAENVTVEGHRNVIIQSNQALTFRTVFNCTSTLGSATALTANASKGGTSVDVTSASGLSAGQLVVIKDSTYKFSTSGQNLELNTIASIVGNTVTLANRLIGNYTTAASASLTPATTPKRNIVFRNLNIHIPTGGKGGGFYFQEAYDCDVINCRVSGMEDMAAVTCWRAAYIRVTNSTFVDGQAVSTPGYSYGVSIAEACHNCIVSNCYMRNVRENAVSLNARHSKFVDCVCVAPYDSGFNSHGNGTEDCQFINCEVYSSRQYGFVAGFGGGSYKDERIRFVNCRSFDSGSYAFTSSSTPGAENTDIEFINCLAVRPGVTVATNYGFYISRSIRPRLINCSVRGGGSNVRAGMLIEISVNAVVSGGDIYNLPSSWGIIHENCTGILIENLNISSIAGSTQGVHATGTASTKVIVKNCRIDNDVVFTKNTNDTHYDNVYNTKFQNSPGVQKATSIADGGTITHNMVATPTAVMVSGSVTGEMVDVTTITSSNFTVAIKKHDNSIGTTQTIYWMASS